MEFELLMAGARSQHEAARMPDVQLTNQYQESKVAEPQIHSKSEQACKMTTSTERKETLPGSQPPVSKAAHRR